MYQAPDMNSWRGRVNPEPFDFLLHQIVQPLDMSDDLFTSSTNNHQAILGFCSDEGVRRNLGRIGARRAPEMIRKLAAGLAVHFDVDQLSVYDAGNVLCASQNLESAQRLLGEKVNALLHQGITPIVLGGGHETAFGHFIGLHSFIPKNESIGIVNLDAHFDVRSYEKGPHSGSPFRQIAELTPGLFHYLPVGIRPESNVSSLFRFMREHDQGYIELAELHQDFSSSIEKVETFCKKVDHVYVTIDMDVFPSAYAPGVSASAPDGMLPHHVLEIIKTIKSSKKWLSCDIVELNPDFDIDDRTAKLAAKLMYHILH
jgi:formiminoglutamase